MFIKAQRVGATKSNLAFLAMVQPKWRYCPSISSPAHLKSLPKTSSLKQSERLGGEKKSGSIAQIKLGLKHVFWDDE